MHSSPGPRPTRTMTLGQARRTALAAQGLAASRPEPHPATPTTGTTDVPRTASTARVHRVVERLGLLQIDSVNVLARAHLVPVFSRLGPYDTAVLDRASSRAPRRLVEYWAHEASLVPPGTYRLLEWRQRRYATEAWGSVRSAATEHGSVVDEVRDVVRVHGPLTAAEVEQRLTTVHQRDTGAWGWNWTVAKRALELLFFAGEVTSAGRTATFARRYDLTERVLPAAVLAAPAVEERDAVRSLVEIAARAHGVGTVRCFADYFRLRTAPARAAVEELVEDGVVEPVVVRGWDRPTFVHRDARTPRTARARTLLSPFDPLVFERRRLAELFGTHYRIEIYVPAPQRRHGYYVLPFLEGEHVTARVDLKADRQAKVLRVLSAHTDPGVTPETPRHLAAELWTLARWLDLDDVLVVEDGDLAPALRRAVAARD
ncbi:winged helix-turn-helix domain-containing protein [Sanguibacter suaedae]|uniref:YcaQ family DNA glycosylase n=1 Tax=Sanguibacter suaedae TaxID=2795737 RepID=A0A934ICV6_9MICO|nr:crosslink repair DNA glycosylase YcaQ family protein [Sanguibacter suaedae]MBI9116032.1 YcaQ family DNA glycosylase [Sanguibacter suaedae]